MSFWDMTYSDNLRIAITEQTSSTAQKNYFLAAYERMGEFIQQHDEYLTFREYFDMYERM